MLELLVWLKVGVDLDLGSTVHATLGSTFGMTFAGTFEMTSGQTNGMMCKVLSRWPRVSCMIRLGATMAREYAVAVTATVTVTVESSRGAEQERKFLFPFFPPPILFCSVS
jgi:hypothetical protein